MIDFKGTLTPALYSRALRLHGAAPPWFGVLLLLVGIVALGISIATRSDSTVAVAVPAAILTLGVFVLIYPRLLASRAFKTNALMRDGFAASANESELAVRTPYGGSNIPWEKFYQASVRDEMVLLYISAQQFLILPRVFFASDPDWSAFQTLVRERVQPRKQGRLILRVALLWMAITVCVYLLWALTSAPT